MRLVRRRCALFVATNEYKGAIQLKTTRKSKKKVVVTTAASLLVLTSLGMSAYAANNMDTIKKNQLLTESGSAFSNAASNSTVGGTAKQDTKTVQTDGAVTQARAIEIGSQALSNMIGVDLSRNNLTHDAVYLGNEQLQETVYASPVWQINWMSSDLKIEKSSGAFESHTVTVDAETGEIVSIRSDGVVGSTHSIQDMSEESGKSMARDFIEKNGFAKGTSIEEINMYNFFGKALLAKLKLANGQQATVVVSKLTGGVISYEGDVKESAYNVDTITKVKNHEPSVTPAKIK
jgi:hypothetical protein